MELLETEILRLQLTNQKEYPGSYTYFPLNIVHQFLKVELGGLTWRLHLIGQLDLSRNNTGLVYGGLNTELCRFLIALVKSIATVERSRHWKVQTLKTRPKNIFTRQVPICLGREGQLKNASSQVTHDNELNGNWTSNPLITGRFLMPFVHHSNQRQRSLQDSQVI